MKVIVTRHLTLIEILVEQGLCGSETKVLSHAAAEDIKGKDVIGVLPLHLAALARSITEVTLNLPPEARGRELTADEIRQYFAGVRTYQVREIQQAEPSAADAACLAAAHRRITSQVTGEPMESLCEGNLAEVAGQFGTVLCEKDLPLRVGLDSPVFLVDRGYNGKRPLYVIPDGPCLAMGTRFGRESKFSFLASPKHAAERLLTAAERSRLLQ